VLYIRFVTEDERDAEQLLQTLSIGIAAKVGLISDKQLKHILKPSSAARGFIAPAPPRFSLDRADWSNNEA
jgi:hypothetical protein